MAGMPGAVAKPAILKRVDDVSRHPVRRKKFLQDLEDWQGQPDLVDVLIANGTVRPGGRNSEEYHLRDHWYNKFGGGWWKNHPHQPHLMFITRWGLIQSFRESVDRDLPVDSYWICFGNDFATNVFWSAEQVTRILLTPPTAEVLVPNQLTQPQPILVIKVAEPNPEQDEIHREGAIAFVNPKTYPYTYMHIMSRVG